MEISMIRKTNCREDTIKTKKHRLEPHTPIDDQIKSKRSLGALRPNQNKTKPKSPGLIGELHFQRHTLEEICRQLDEDSAEVVCNIAGWKNRDQQGEYLTVEVSPKFVPHRRPPSDAGIFDGLFNEEDE
jgi:hypothetical protein